MVENNLKRNKLVKLHKLVTLDGKSSQIPKNSGRQNFKVSQKSCHNKD